MKIVSWNTRGLNSPSKRVQIKNLLSRYLPDFVILVETKLTVITKKIVKSLWSSISIKWRSLSATGNSGGIIIMWDDLRFNVTDFIEGSSSLSIKINIPDGPSSST